MIRTRDRLGHFIPRDTWEDIWLAVTGEVPRNRRRSAPLSRVEWVEIERDIAGVDPAGTEYELTATTAGGSPQGKGYADPRVLHLKIRVVSEHDMRLETALALLERSVRARQVVAGIQVHAIDWAKGHGAGAETGKWPTNLRKFYGAIHQATQTRFAKVQP